MQRNSEDKSFFRLICKVLSIHLHFFFSDSLHNPKTCVPLQPAKELAECSVRVLKARFKNNESASDTVQVLLKKPTETVRDESNSEGGVRHWYGNKFYVWGYQTVKDPEMRFEDRNRSVFYLIKVDAY